MSERLQKFLARAGVASRRHAEGLITAGRVSVNNQRVTELGTKVEPTDLVTVDGTLVDKEAPPPPGTENIVEELADPTFEQGLEAAAPGADEAMEALEQAMEEA
ncbi:MAG TPA: S4 domain-containing protein, partial [Myxococcaceae bacterium]|nr:S4 domain-containing protein [Myxococcaceae bacterium]